MDPTTPRRWILRGWAMLPHGGRLPPDVRDRRHRGVLALLWMHVPGLFAVALACGESPVHAAFEAGLIAAIAMLAGAARWHPRTSITLASIGLLTCSATLVHLTGGVIEMHFHFFVMIGVVTLYQEWAPYLVGMAFVASHHGVMGVVDPAAVYDHPAAVASPWHWLAVHAGFIFAMSIVGIVSWKLNELLLDDVTERQQALLESADATREALSLLQATLDSTADAILVVDRDGRITSYNGRFAAMWDLPEDSIAVGDDATLLARVAEQLHDSDDYLHAAATLTADDTAESLDMVFFRDGRVFERFSMPQRVDGEIVGRVWSFRDVTDRTRLEAELVHEAFHDSLTGLPNKSLFQDRLDHALARLEAPGGAHLAVLFVDLDNFKHVNDSLGHAAGDALIVEVAARLGRELRPADTVARLGGDEFAVLLEDLTDLRQADEVAERLLHTVQTPFLVAGAELFTSASIGIAGAGPSATGEQVLRDADLAMYTAKRLGKDRAERFETHMHAQAVERLQLEADLHRACERDELRLQYQPIVSLGTGELVGVEALVRWQHPRRGFLGPGAFIPYAEESGIIDRIGLWVLERAVAQACEWQQPDRPPIGISVNLAPRQLRDDTFVATIDELLSRTGLGPERLTLEITETAMMVDADLALVRLQQLKDLGVRLAIDDFGTGYSSLSHLRQFPIDIIKIDRSFIDRVEHGPEESALTRAIVRLAQTLELSAVAEGVENERQIELLRTIGCELAQGFHLSRPVDADRISDLLADGVPLLGSETRLTGV